MKNKFSAKASVVINKPVEKVWQALTDPEIIKQYFFGVNVVTDWKVGSPIIYKGIWEGKEFQDKGIILKNIPNQILESSYWSNFSGLADSPDNYSIVKYTLSQRGDNTYLEVVQDNIQTEQAATHSERNWNFVLESLKKLLENN